MDLIVQGIRIITLCLLLSELLPFVNFYLTFLSNYL